MHTHTHTHRISLVIECNSYPCTHKYSVYVCINSIVDSVNCTCTMHCGMISLGSSRLVRALFLIKYTSQFHRPNVLRSDQNFLYILKRFVVFPNDASADPTRKCGGKAMTQGQQRQYRQCSAVSLFVTNLGKFKSK